MSILIAAIVGLISGILVNYLSDVLPTRRTLTRPFCIQCDTNFTLKEYLLLNTCPNCGRARSWRAYASLPIAIFLSVVLWLNPPERMGYWLGLAVLLYFAVVIVIDIEHRLILHMVALPGALLGLLVGTVRNNLPLSLIGGLVGLGMMLIFYWLGTLFARYRARKLGHDDGEEALGFGDVTISAVLGLMLGWPMILYGLTIGIIAGGVFSLVFVLFLMARRKYQTMSVFTAYGPYLVFGAALIMFYPPFLTFLSGK